jgi:hypothetical protein
MSVRRKWFTVGELRSRWGITDIDLWDMMKGGELTPYYERHGEIELLDRQLISKFTLDTYNRVVPSDSKVFVFDEEDQEGYRDVWMPLFGTLLFRASEIFSVDGEHEEGKRKQEERKSRDDYTYLTSEQLMIRWGMSETELVAITAQETIPRHFHYSDDIADVDKASEDAVLHLMGQWPIPIKEWVFKLTDVEKLERRIPDLRKDEHSSIVETELVEKLREELALVISDRDQWKGKAESLDAQTQMLDGKERQELGRLRQEKDKWNESIKAAVHAALLCQNGKIKRDELKDKLHKFHLPDTVIESIWKALREKGLTKKAGRPPASNK